MLTLEEVEKVELKPITKFLESLGDTEEDIAESMRGLKIIGLRRASCRCPLATACLVYSRLGGGTPPSIGYDYSGGIIGLKLTWDDCQTMDPTLPKNSRALASFARNFDRGDYPNLEGDPQKIKAMVKYREDIKKQTS